MEQPESLHAVRALAVSDAILAQAAAFFNRRYDAWYSHYSGPGWDGGNGGGGGPPKDDGRGDGGDGSSNPGSPPNNSSGPDLSHSGSARHANTSPEGGQTHRPPQETPTWDAGQWQDHLALKYAHTTTNRKSSSIPLFQGVAADFIEAHAVPAPETPDIPPGDKQDHTSANSGFSTHQGPRPPPDTGASSGRKQPDPDEPPTPGGKVVEAYLTDEMSQRPEPTRSRLKQILQAFQKSPLQQELPANRQKCLWVGMMFATLLDAAGVPGGGELRTLTAEDLLKVRWLEDRPATQFVKDVLDGKPGAALDIINPKGKHTSRFTVADLSPLQKFSRNLYADRHSATVRLNKEASTISRSTPPTLDHFYPAYYVMDNKLSHAVEELGVAATKSLNSEEPIRDYSGLKVYPDLLPGQLGDDRGTAYDTRETQYLEKLRSHSEAPEESLEKVKEAASRYAFNRSRDYDKMQGFPDLGGVLLGLLPSHPSQNTPQSSPTDCVDLSWRSLASPDDDKIEIRLRTRNGNELISPTYPKSLVREALTYAADGRTMAVTIINTSFLPDQKILLHPGLIDTPLGQRIIEMDKFIFDEIDARNSAGDPLPQAKAWNDASELVTGANALYKMAQNSRHLALLDQHFAPKLSYIDEAYQSAKSAKATAQAKLAEGEAYLKWNADTVIPTRDDLQKMQEDQRQGNPTPVTGQSLRDLFVLPTSTPTPSMSAPTVDNDTVESFRDWVRKKQRDFLSHKPEYQATLRKVRRNIQELTAKKGKIDKEKKLVQQRDTENRNLRNAKSKAIINKVLQYQVFSDPSKTPLSAKKEFYDWELVKLMDECAKTNRSLASFLDAIYERSCEQFENASGDKLKRLYHRWLTPAPEMNIVSGVREKPYAFEAKNYMLERGHLLPDTFDYVAQTVYASPPGFLEDIGKQGDYYDQQPWQFPTIRAAIDERTRRYIAADTRRQTIVRDVTEFVFLQRLFRLALRGDLGRCFPGEQLVVLSTVVQTRDLEHTPRWHLHPALERELEDAIAHPASRRKYLENRGLWRAGKTTANAARHLLNALVKTRQAMNSESEEQWDRQMMQQPLSKL